MLLSDWNDLQKRKAFLSRVVLDFQEKLNTEQIAQEDCSVPAASETDLQRIERILKTGLVTCTADLTALIRANSGALGEEDVEALLTSVRD